MSEMDDFSPIDIPNAGISVLGHAVILGRLACVAYNFNRLVALGILRNSEERTAIEKAPTTTVPRRDYDIRLGLHHDDCGSGLYVHRNLSTSAPSSFRPRPSERVPSLPHIQIEQGLARGCSSRFRVYMLRNCVSSFTAVGKRTSKVAPSVGISATVAFAIEIRRERPESPASRGQ